MSENEFEMFNEDLSSDVPDLKEVDFVESYHLDTPEPHLNISHEENDLFEYFGSPGDNAFDYHNFIKCCKESYQYSLECDNEEKRHTTSMTEEEIIESNKVSIQEIENKMNRSLDPEVKRIYMVYNYPLSHEVYHQFNIKNEVAATYGALLWLYTIGYQYIYHLEKRNSQPVGNIPGMLNRAKSDGPYGIWGHHISDLVYNGYSTISFGKDQEGIMSVICKFECDS